ncbi:class I SAM-dependent methyltransferase [Actinomadura craniellae]|uniref:Class I SAM-dependent methyltransferase n=1 Tax=Actinomadura craniellae TaxID=2231787 RepID=A0A365H5G4_9ACTN|nr:methyltransferase domain-containing protein [Actinomadura craniellae]RAY14331.1 class I SAM-dependent methyltransferase [Actinomadura craniellae]
MTDLRTPPVNDGDLFSERVRQYAYDRPLQRVQVLEAGCGQGFGLDLRDVRRSVTGVDIDLPGLRAHTEGRADLDSWHLGDLRTVPMPPRAYDVVHASYLIERITQAELVLDRFVAALKPGGLLLVRFRDRATAYGALDRLLPGGLGRLEGRDGPASIYETVASHQGMQWYCMMRGLMVAEEYAGRAAFDRLGRWRGPVDRLCRAVTAASRGRLSGDHTEMAMVIRKPENRFARVI